MNKRLFGMGLGLSLLLAFDSAGIVSGVRQQEGQSRQSSQEARVRQDTRHRVWTVGSGANQRRAVDTSSREMPLHVTSINNLDNEDWLRHLEIELENKSNRPIYHVLIILMFPQVPKSTELDGLPRGLASTMMFGRQEFLTNRNEMATATDVAIQPGKKVLLTMTEEHSQGVKNYLMRHGLPVSTITRVTIRIDKLSFGDGSGYHTGGAPYSRSISQNYPPVSRPDGRVRVVGVRYSLPSVQHGCDGQSWNVCGYMHEVIQNNCAGSCLRGSILQRL